MCIVDSLHSLSRRGFFGSALAAGVALGAADLGKSLFYPGIAEGAQSPAKNGGPGTSGVSFKWFGTDGWEITFGTKTVLLDPWLSRTDAGLFSGKFNPKTPAKIEEALIDQHIKKADQILIGHGHFDHIADVPYIAKKTGATVIGSESHMNMLRAHGLPEPKLVPCRGGEFFQFDGYTIEVFRSLHSLQPTKKVPFPGRFLSVPTIPATIAEMPEGDSLIYMLTVGGKFSIFLMSTANFIEREIVGLRPDVALVAPLGRGQVPNFTARLLKAINDPKMILPTHWDNWERPLSDPPQDLRNQLGDAGNIDLFVNEIKQVSPKCQVVTMNFLQSFSP
jgi:L-ascorbate metabolism protein UlaG (beta-lactamase superfamily)